MKSSFFVVVPSLFLLFRDLVRKNKQTRERKRKEREWRSKLFPPFFHHTAHAALFRFVAHGTWRGAKGGVGFVLQHVEREKKLGEGEKICVGWWREKQKRGGGKEIHSGIHQCFRRTKGPKIFRPT